MKTILRRIRGALGNAAVWGGAWTVASVLWIGWILVKGLIFTPELVAATDWGSSQIWLALLGFIGYTAVIGAGTGIAFSTYLAANFRRKTLEDLSSMRTALGGGLVTLLVGLVIYMALGAPAGIGFDDVLPLISWGTVLGSGMGYASVAAAKRALPHSRSSETRPGTAQPLETRRANSPDARLELTR
ncbi:MAG: hypothetical protein P8Y02_12415 [Deinococcales bacterium]